MIAFGFVFTGVFLERRYYRCFVGKQQKAGLAGIWETGVMPRSKEALWEQGEPDIQRLGEGARSW